MIDRILRVLSILALTLQDVDGGKAQSGATSDAE